MALVYTPVELPGTAQFMQTMANQMQERVGSAWDKFRELNLDQQSTAQEQMALQGHAPAMAAWNQGNQFPPSQQQGNDGFNSNVPRSLINTESGGNWGAQNSVDGAGGNGHYGILQFSRARFAEAQAAGAVPSDMSIEAFATNTPAGRQAQINAANWHFSDIDRRIAAQGYDRLVGQNIGGVPITMDGMRSMAHLGGFGGLSKFINSGGRYNPADAFGTSLSKYGKTHASY